MKKFSKTLSSLAAASLLAIGTSAVAQPMCANCHGTGVGPAIADVVKAYGSVDAVLEFLNSDAQIKTAKIAEFAGRESMMNPNLAVFRGYDDAKKKEVRDWLEANK